MFNASEILSLAKRGETEKIIELCRQALIEEAAKERGGNRLLKRTKAARKIMGQLEEWQLPRCGAVIREQPDGSICQCFTNGYYAFALKEPLDGLPESSKENTPNIPELINEAESRMSNMQEVEIDLPVIKAHIKEHKASNQSRRKSHIAYDIGKCRYSAQFIVDVYTILGGDIRFYQDENTPFKPAFIQSENGRAILIPMKPR